jgi:drug/metabolite transporter (DMT)-like permease
VPVFTVLYREIFLGESVMPWTQLCASLIVCGTALSTGSLRFGQGKKLGALTTAAPQLTPDPLQLQA